MQHLHRSFCAVILMTLAACETVLNIDPPAYDPELAVTSRFMPDSLWSATVHMSQGAGVVQDPRQSFVADAIVTIMRGGSIVDTLRHAGRGRYVSKAEQYPEAGVPYHLRVQTHGAGTAESEATAPIPAPIAEASIENLGVVPGSSFNEQRFALRFRVEDPPGRNFYRFGIYRYRYNQDRDYYPDLNLPDSVYESVWLGAGNPTYSCGYVDAYEGTTSAGGGCASDGGGVFTDNPFDGQSYQVTVTFDMFEPTSGTESKDILLLLSTLSKEFFEYERTREIQQYSDFVAVAPVNIYSNVEGGLGIFAGYSNVSVLLPIPFER